MSTCRFCHQPLETIFLDLGSSPISNDYLSPSSEFSMEPFYPLQALVCDNCFLVQLRDIERTETLFTDNYAYFSSYSSSWVQHARRYAAKMIASEHLDLNLWWSR